MPSLKGVGESLIANALWIIVPAAAVLAASLLDEQVELWAVPLASALSLAVGLMFGRRASRSLARYQADLLADAITGLQHILAGKLTVSFEDYMERGVLGPARFGLISVSGEDVRLSILIPADDDAAFRMAYESGHSVGRKESFSLSLSGTLAGHAMQSRELEWANNVDRDRRWSEHPEARVERGYGSLAVMPVLVGDDCIGVLSVIAKPKRAFRRGDLTFIELLGTLIGLTWTIRPENPPGEASTLPSGSAPDPDGGSE